MEDELDWLEADLNSYYDNDSEFDLDLEPPPPPFEPEPSPKTGPDNSNSKKRPNPIEEIVDDKRIKLDEVTKIVIDNDDDEDEEWMRYSPLHEKAKKVVTEVVEEVTEVVEEVTEEKFVLRNLAEIEGEFMPVTGTDGERVYAIKKGEDEEGSGSVNNKLSASSKGHLMMEPISLLMQKVEEDALQKALQDSVSSQTDTIIPGTPVVSERLWVDKYSPNSFMELLSDEHTNREVLLWLKQWDSSVFGSELKTTTDDVLSALKRHTTVVQHKKISNRNSSGWNKDFKSNSGNFKEHNHFDKENYNSHGDQELHNKKSKEPGPPEQKILLLCGAPGLGKTTLAHVAAKHCGYRVVEINASDDRSSSTIEAKILDVVQMNSVIADPRPKCLVIDEIDGALGEGKGAVDVILKMVTADKRSDTGTESIAQSEKSKKKKKDAPLLRPVICICNDLYAPALRQLRQVAKVHVFVQPTVNRIVSRLKFICNKEGMRTSSVALTALAEYTECDIRSCLNTLQFLNKRKEMLNVLDISSQVVGRKDSSKSVFDVWKEVFQKKRLKGVRKSMDGCKGMLNEFDSLHSLISNCGSYDLILDGIHENMLHLNYHDPVMRKTVKCLHSLETSDILHQYIMRTQKMSLQVYQPANAITIHTVVSQVEKPNIQWPKAFHRYRTTLIDKVESLHLWHHKISPSISRHISHKSFVEDLVSPLLHILSPPTLRPVALHLLSEKEKNEMAQLVKTMVSYAITYKNKKVDPLPNKSKYEVTMDAPVLLSFDPPIADFVNFEGYNCNYFLLALAVKQVLCHEVENQKILQSSLNKAKNGNVVYDEKRAYLAGKENISKPKWIPENTKTISGQKQSDTNTKAPVNTFAPALGKSAVTYEVTKPTETKKKRVSGTFNFFERFKRVSVNGSQITEPVIKVAATSERDSRPVLFKYNEGYTNAVKRPVRMHEFFLRQ